MAFAILPPSFVQLRPPGTDLFTSVLPKSFLDSSDEDALGYLKDRAILVDHYILKCLDAEAKRAKIPRHRIEVCSYLALSFFFLFCFITLYQSQDSCDLFLDVALGMCRKLIFYFQTWIFSKGNRVGRSSERKKVLHFQN